MSLKTIKKQLKDAGIKGSVRYLGNEIRAKGYGIHESTCMYEITFPKIEGEEYWDEPIEVIDDSEASCKIEDYVNELLVTNWHPKFFVDIDENAEDGDYLRKQDCCTSCGAYIGDLPGYYWIEDSDACPICRASNNEEKWSDEVHRIMVREKLDEDEIKQTLNALSEYSDV